MDTVTVSPKFQVVIPSKVREELNIRPGQKLLVLTLDGIIRLIPVRPMREYRGSMPGINTDVEREEDDRV